MRFKFSCWKAFFRFDFRMWSLEKRDSLKSDSFSDLGFSLLTAWPRPCAHEVCWGAWLLFKGAHESQGRGVFGQEKLTVNELTILRAALQRQAGLWHPSAVATSQTARALKVVCTFSSPCQTRQWCVPLVERDFVLSLWQEGALSKRCLHTMDFRFPSKLGLSFREKHRDCEGTVGDLARRHVTAQNRRFSRVVRPPLRTSAK